MSRRVRFKRRARADLKEARAWLDGERDGLGREFFADVESSLSPATTMPERFKIIVPGYRRVNLRRFRYLIIFRFDDEKLTVIAVYHASRDPGTWATRIAQDIAEGGDG